MKRGRGSSFEEMGATPRGLGKSSSKSSFSSGNNNNDALSQKNWCTLPSGNTLPTTDGTIGLLDTQLPTLKDGATNPTGAVAVARYNGRYYCFASSCPTCQIPLTKAELYEPATDAPKAPRLACTFCQATYSLQSGQKVAAAKPSGFFGGMVNRVFASKASGPLPLYQLAEKNGQLLIALEQK
jgi:nitrite reductase/ring-hydroxylating ferredoxin subunit